MLTQDDGTCTLPEAIKAANTDTASGASTGECAAGFGADDMITFSVSGTIYTTRLPDITQGVTINGGNKVTLNAEGGSSFFIANATGSTSSTSCSRTAGPSTVARSSSAAQAWLISRTPR